MRIGGIMAEMGLIAPVLLACAVNYAIAAEVKYRRTHSTDTDSAKAQSI
jgi:hypothetical protein